MNKIILLIIVACDFLNVSGQNFYSLNTNISVNIEVVKEGFLHLPDESKLRCYWWWLNSMATKESITRDLEEMKAKGYGGASIVDAGSSNYSVAQKTAAGPVFMSAEWMELYQHAVKEADRVGIELSVNVQSGWNPGAPSITPDMALKKLVYNEIEVAGGKQLTIRLLQPETTLAYKDVMVQAIPLPAKNSPVKNDAIIHWDKKSFNRAMGWQGIYPLHELRDGFNHPVNVNVIRKEDIIDLTANFDGATLKWDAPKGDWLVIRYGWTCTGARTSTTSDGWEGFSLDHLNPAAFELFRETVIQPLIDSAQAVGNSVRFLQTDSWEMGTVNWTNRFPEEFEKFRGYKLDKYLPVMTGRVVESQEISNRFLHDLRKTVGDCVAENHYRLFAELAHKHGMGIHPESGGPHSAPVDALKVMAISDFPQGEFWARSNTHRVSDAARLAVKQSACVAHTNGKRFVAAEGPTSIGPQWERSPKDLKANLDRIFCSGVNRIVWHTFTSSPEEFGKPGNEYFAGTHLNPNVTWWEQSADFISYLNRCSFMLQQGVFVADVLYYYGDDVPNFVFLKEEYPELNFGYDWDKCSKDIILNRVSFDGEKIVLPDGMSYRILVLAPEQAIDLEVLKKVEELVHAGLTVITPRPKATTGLRGYPQSDKELAGVAARLWGNIDGENTTENRYGKGRVIWGQDVNEILAGMRVNPDLTFSSPDKETALDYIHRRTDSADIYFMVNRFARKGINDFEYRYLTDLPDRFEQVECKFRVTGKTPQLWNPQTGEVRPVAVYREEDGHTIVPLHLEPEGSVFVVFTDQLPENHIVKIEKDGKKLFPGNEFEAKAHPFITFEQSEGQWKATAFKPGNYSLFWSNGRIQTVKFNETAQVIPVAGSWNVHFDTEWGGPGTIVLDELKSWTELSEDGVRYYSGTAVYEKDFHLKKTILQGKKAMLSLGNLHEMAVVKLNGHRFNLNWAPPYEMDVTNYLKDGKNELEIEVTNLWPNRLIGDGKLPEQERLTKTNINKFDGPDAEKFLRESGLIGPVSLIFSKKMNIK
ncbi:glycosyl hydrolase [Gaoshiqia sp. Z1-71]|uniref:glycosyl hydrolase n=1 Tax=Gaoshiqia hydrogeniformans TaxID=3290090 RepID=UPI003BF8EB2F